MPCFFGPLFCPWALFFRNTLLPSFLSCFWVRSFALLFCIVFGPAVLAPLFCLFLGLLFWSPFLPHFWARFFDLLFCLVFGPTVLPSVLGPALSPFFFCSVILFYSQPLFWLCLLRFGLSFGCPKRPSRKLATKRQIKLSHGLMKWCPKLEHFLKGIKNRPKKGGIRFP